MTPDILGVIPARGGSKRVDRKNLRDVGEKPLIAHAIEHANAATTLDRAVVSSEDKEIRDVAREWGGDVPFERPAELATDTATNDEVVAHAIEWFEERGTTFEYVCLVPATTPFREPADIDAAVESLVDADADSVVGVTPYDAPPFWAVETTGGQLDPYFDENPWEKTRTQEFPELSHPNGAVFAAAVPAFERAGGFYCEETLAYEMPQKRSIDIDEPIDLEIARALMEEP